MNIWSIIGIVLLVILIIVGIFFIIYKKFIIPKVNQYNDIMKQHKSTMSIFIISKTKGKLTDENVPKSVIDQIPKFLRGKKFPLVKAKVGPQIVTLIADEKIYNKIPIKKLVKADIAGMYLVDIR
ncbi:MAG: hypothetical protein A2Y24_03865 [Clostridiales bacterium GWE2_32_10]|nr:MAG: hypothetical protein A2Y24_03865 [Clostridiales bacterium GWE2_32_10]HBY19592.1 hypothetical protein [Clostridiales bacterium]